MTVTETERQELESLKRRFTRIQGIHINWIGMTIVGTILIAVSLGFFINVVAEGLSGYVPNQITHFAKFVSGTLAGVVGAKLFSMALNETAAIQRYFFLLNKERGEGAVSE